MTNNDQPCGFGDFLFSARQAKGLSLEKVSEQTKIPVSKLKELENEDLEKLPAAVFVKGFIKAYATAVGVDASEANQLYEKCIDAQQKPDSGIPVVQPQKASRFWLKFVLVIAIIGLLVFAVVRINTDIDFGMNDPMPASLSENQQTESKPSDALDDANVTGNTLSDANNAAESQPETSVSSEPPLTDDTLLSTDSATSLTNNGLHAFATASPEDTADDAVVAEKQTDREHHPESDSGLELAIENHSEISDASNLPDQNELNHESSVSQITSGSIPQPEATSTLESFNTLFIEAIELTWLEYTIDDLQTKEITLRPNAELILKSKESIELHVGNAGGIKLKYNEQDMGVPGKSGQVLTLKIP